MELDDIPGIEDLSQFQVTSRREIVNLLRSIAKHNQLVRMLIGNGMDAVVTSILAVDDEEDMVVVDISPNPAQNARIVEADKVSFETLLEHIRILFFTPKVFNCVYEGLPAFKFQIPETVVRLQRREYYRVPTPVTNPVKCTIIVPDEDGETSMTHILPLQNVSGGGIALIDEKKLLDNTIGRIYKDCRIDLPGGTVVVATIQIRNCYDITLTNGKNIRRLGCLFVNVPKAMMASIQRYITRLEREQNARVTGNR